MASFSNVGQYSGYSTWVLRWKHRTRPGGIYHLLVTKTKDHVEWGFLKFAGPRNALERGSRRPRALPFDGDIAKTQDDAAAGCKTSKTHLRTEP
jgi:hypothetical protein